MRRGLAAAFAILMAASPVIAIEVETPGGVTDPFAMPPASGSPNVALPDIPSNADVLTPPTSVQPSTDLGAFALAYAGIDETDDGRAAEAAESEPNQHDHRWAEALGDVDGDGVSDLAIQSRDPATFETSAGVISGATGQEIWNVPLGISFPQLFPAPGDPISLPPAMVRPAGDLNGDHANDIIAFFIDFELQIPPPSIEPLIDRPVGLLVITASYQGLDGRTGQSLWTEDASGLVAWYSTSLTYEAQVVVYQNVPTGWLLYEHGDEDRFVHKTTDIHIEVLCDSLYRVTGACIVWAANEQRTEHIRAYNPAGLEALWQRDLQPQDEPQHVAESWLEAARNLGGGNEPDLILSQKLSRNPRHSEYANPITQDPAFVFGRGMNVLVLDGDDGQNLWSQRVFEEPPVRANAATEEPFPILIRTRAHDLDDVTLDGNADVLARYYVVDSTSPGTSNGIFRTHFVLMDGATGQLQFDTEYTGWGTGVALGTPEDPKPFIGIGTVDQAQIVAGQGAFPLEELHLAVLNAGDGTPRWDASFRFAQDNYLPGTIGLHQYLTNLAPYDYDGDGVKDLVTPAIYDPPEGANQTLLSTATHHYRVLSGADQGEMLRVTARGPFGLVMPCDQDDGALTIVSGHSRRWDVARIDVLTGDVAWQETVHFDERPRPGTAPVSLTWLSPHCTRHDDGQETWSLTFNTKKVGQGPSGIQTETYGTLAQQSDRETGGLVWLDPVIGGDAPDQPSILEAPIIASEQWWNRPEALLIPAMVLPGALAGVMLRRSRTPTSGGERK